MKIEKRLRRGFTSGIALSLLVAAGIFTAVHVTNAQSNGSGLLGGDSTDSVSSATTTTSTATSSTGLRNTPATEQTSNNVATTTGSNRYVALGDSVAAGLGLPLVANANQQDTTCGRSSQSYAYEVGRQLNYDTSLFACSGATAGDLITRQGIDGPNPIAQVTAAFAGGQPDVISITAGANDAQWQRFIQKCYAGTCGTKTDTTIANGALVLLQAKLNLALTAIKARSQDTPPTVVLTGYYNPVSDRCTALQNQVTAAEISWLTASTAALNKTIQDIAATHGSFVRYAAVDFSGHDLCSAEPWIQGNGASAPLHPTLQGQQAIARSVVQALQ